jgi:hypothetical protein
MKKIARKIAMILVLVMLANCFTSCFTIWGIKEATRTGNQSELIAYGIFADLAIVGIILLGILLGGRAETPDETEIYLANAEHNPLMDYYFALNTLNSLTEMERVVLMEKLNSLPTVKRDDLIRTVTSLPQAEITVSIERLNALSEAELASTVQDFNALSEVELDSVIDKLNERVNSLPVADYVAVIKNLL